MDLINIASSWAAFLKGTPETQNLMNYRLSKCETCPHKVQLSSAGAKILTTLNQSSSVFKCGLCGCPLAGLTAGPKNKCKDNRWGIAGTESMY